MIFQTTPRKPRSTLNGCLLTLAIIGALGLFSAISDAILPVLLFSGVAYGAYFLTTRKNALEKKNTALRLQDLKENISRCDRQIKLLDNYLDQKNYTQYAILARQILPQLRTIQEESKSLKNAMDLTIYKRIITRASNEEDSIKVQLEAWNLLDSLNPTSDEEKAILTRAPEIATTYQNIQRDHFEILEKLKTAENSSELEAIHDINMTRFRDILQGYLKIKESPKDFYNADERLAQAKTALEKFDRDLDETLRKLNESQLSDFEISLRMMEEKTSSDIY